MKLWNYMAIMMTMMVFLAFLGYSPIGSKSILNQAGIVINETTGELMEGDISNSSWADKLFNPLTGLLVGLGTAVVIGYFTRSFEWKLVMLPFFTTFVATFLSFGWGIVQLAKDTGEVWLVGIIATIFLPLTAMFIFSVIEYFGGSE